MLTKEQIASLFKGWKKLYRSKMKDEDWDMDTVKVWLIVLNDMNTTDQEFNLAKRVSIRHEWPPTHPVDFLKLGRTETASNYPDMRTEYLAAAQGNYKHEVTLETAKRVGTWELKTQPESVSYKSWQKHYVEVCKEHSEGADFKVPESHQVAYSHTPVQPGSETDKQITAKLAELRRLSA
ncbi:hypothetical protein BTW00_05465 [Psychrobacter sp. C 20.9]|uniref:hypothetical protein n=1 Tax=Psychrobacter sp. C 20.9 TaxID=1926477 RepID=UPI0009468E6F|nr:hypothetical protein [Psychrobacter sp. C 20.9]OLF36535.1 hypothetical protein BTW00_05465 [Psychrobacter sp. C 20.9]